MTVSYFLTLFFCSVLFGGTIGAYYGTVDYRIRHDKPLLTSHCYCPYCHHTLASIHQIPIISWIFLGGKCHYCKTPIPLRYPLIEGGFLLYYGVTFLLLWKQPLSLLCVWLGFIFLIILLRGQGHLHSMLKGIYIFTGFHAVYGAVFLIICASLQII